MMRIEPIRCLRCGSIFQNKEKDLVFICGNCGTGQILDRGQPEMIPFDVAGFVHQSPLEKVYIPFWRVYVTIQILSEKIEGGGFFKLMDWISGGGRSGDAFIYMPGFDMDPHEFKEWAARYTSSPPRYRPVQGLSGIRRLPLSIKRDEASAMADFIIVSHEAEKPGVLQQLNYSMRINELRLIYLPFYWDGRQYFPGL